MALLCGAGFLRAVSSSLVWVYSTLVVQNKVLGEAGGNPWANPMFGRGVIRHHLPCARRR